MAEQGSDEGLVNAMPMHAWGRLNIMVFNGIGIDIKLGLVIFQNIDPGRGNWVTTARSISQLTIVSYYLSRCDVLWTKVSEKKHFRNLLCLETCLKWIHEKVLRIS